MKESKLLIGRKMICAYLDDISVPQFYKFLKIGMPAVVLDNRWYAHADNLDNFFQKLTFARVKNIPDNAE